MKTIIAGGREFLDYDVLVSVIEMCPWEISVVVCGKARGADTLGEEYAKANDIPVLPFPVLPHEWKTIGKSAGHLRNQKMADNADALIAFWDGESRGTKDMITRARKANLRIMIYNYVTGQFLYK